MVFGLWIVVCGPVFVDIVRKTIEHHRPIGNTIENHRENYIKLQSTVGETIENHRDNYRKSWRNLYKTMGTIIDNYRKP